MNENTEKTLVENEDLVKIKDYIAKSMQNAWDKMGNTGDNDYFDNATQDEILNFGYFRGLEDLVFFLESANICIKWTVDEADVSQNANRQPCKHFTQRELREMITEIERT